jgi:hypothetical protein
MYGIHTSIIERAGGDLNPTSRMILHELTFLGPLYELRALILSVGRTL